MLRHPNLHRRPDCTATLTCPLRRHPNLCGCAATPSCAATLTCAAILTCGTTLTCAQHGLRKMEPGLLKKESGLFKLEEPGMRKRSTGGNRALTPTLSVLRAPRSRAAALPNTLLLRPGTSDRTAPTLLLRRSKASWCLRDPGR